MASGRTTRWLALVPGNASAPGQKLIVAAAPNVGLDARARSVARLPGPAAPLAPVPATSPAGGGASGGSGLFFFGNADLPALDGLLVPSVTGSVQTTVAVAAPQPFRSLLERPG
jgi:hypothetical protein